MILQGIAGATDVSNFLRAVLDGFFEFLILWVDENESVLQHHHLSPGVVHHCISGLSDVLLASGAAGLGWWFSVCTGYCW